MNQIRDMTTMIQGLGAGKQLAFNSGEVESGAAAATAPTDQRRAEQSPV
jgi:hypothetical protein